MTQSEKKDYSQMKEYLTCLVETWAAQFDEEERPSIANLLFSVNKDGLVFAGGQNEILLCTADSIDISNFEYGLDCMLIPQVTGAEFVIYIDWPYSGDPVIDKITVSHTIYKHGEKA